MDNDISKYECLICLDLLIEPVTTQCGHTFCKLCICKYLAEKHMCPICRNVLFQTKESINKNFLLENIIKEKFKERYDKRYKDLAPEYEEYNSERNTLLNIPFIAVEQQWIAPGSTRKLIFPLPSPSQPQLAPLNNNTIIPTLNTIHFSSMNDKLLIVYDKRRNPQLTQTTITNKISQLCEITSIYTNNINNTLIIHVKGIKRVKLIKLSSITVNNNLINTCDCESFSDNTDIESNEIKQHLTNLLSNITSNYETLLQTLPYSLQQKIETIYGKPPKLNSNTLLTNVIDVKKMESISLFYLCLLKHEKKEELISKNNLIERIEWLNDEYNKVMKFKDNASFPLLFFDIPECNIDSTNFKFLMIIIICFIIVCLLMKYDIINIH